MPERINGGQALVVVGAIALIVSLFARTGFSPGSTAWTVFESIGPAARRDSPSPPWRSRSVERSAPRGSLAALAPRWLPVRSGSRPWSIVGRRRLVNHPPAAIGRSAETGAWVALGAAAALTVGGILGATARLARDHAPAQGSGGRAERAQRRRRRPIPTSPTSPSAYAEPPTRSTPTSTRRPSTSTPTRATANTRSGSRRPSCRWPDERAPRACPKDERADPDVRGPDRSTAGQAAQRPTAERLDSALPPGLVDRGGDPEVLDREAGGVEQGDLLRRSAGPGAGPQARRRAGSPRRGSPCPPQRPPESSPPSDACSHSSQNRRQRSSAASSTSDLPARVGAEHGEVLARAQVRAEDHRLVAGRDGRPRRPAAAASSRAADPPAELGGQRLGRAPGAGRRRRPARSRRRPGSAPPRRR